MGCTRLQDSSFFYHFSRIASQLFKGSLSPFYYYYYLRDHFCDTVNLPPATGLFIGSPVTEMQGCHGGRWRVSLRVLRSQPMMGIGYILPSPRVKLTSCLDDGGPSRNQLNCCERKPTLCVPSSMVSTMTSRELASPPLPPRHHHPPRSARCCVPPTNHLGLLICASLMADIQLAVRSVFFFA